MGFFISYSASIILSMMLRYTALICCLMAELIISHDCYKQLKCDIKTTNRPEELKLSLEQG